MEGYFEISVHGEYFAQVKDKKELRGYTAVFRLPNAKAPLSVVKGQLLVPFLRKKDPQCAGVYTHYVDWIKCHGRELRPDEIPTRFQTKEQLREYIKFHQLGINVDDYENLGKLREHVRMAKEEPEEFPKVQAKYLAQKEEENALIRLNEGILVETHKPLAPFAAEQEDAQEAEQPAPEPRKRGRKKIKAEEETQPEAEGEELL